MGERHRSGRLRWGLEGFVGGGAHWRVTFLLAFFGVLPTNQRADGST